MRLDNRGIGTLMAQMLVLFLTGAGATTVAMMSSDNESRSLEWSRRQAFQVSQAGLEYAQYKIHQGSDPTVANKPFGPGTFTITQAGDQVTVNSQVGEARSFHTITVASTPPPPPLAPPPEVDNGEVIIDPNREVEVKVLCAEIVSNGRPVPVKSGIEINGSYTTMFGNQAVHGGEIYTINSGPAGSTYRTRGLAYITSSNVRSYWSTNTVQVKTLVNEQVPPNVPGFNGQVPIEQCVANYVQNGRMNLASNQVIFLFELGMNANNYPTHAATDFQDLVLLMTVQ